MHVVGGTLLVLAAIDVALRLLFGIAPPALLRASFHNTGNREIVAARVSGVLVDRGDAPLAVIVGSSSAADGLVSARLTAADPARRRWLNLARTGSSFDELGYAFGPLFASDLRADVVVVAIHTGWFAGKVVGDPTLDALMLPDLPRTSWLLYHRGTLQHLARSALAGARERLLLGLGVRFSDVYPPAAEPWSEREPPETWTHDLGPAVLELWRHKRWFDAAWFDAADDEVAAAAEVLAGCARVGRRVVVVLMPESSILRGEMPAAARAALDRALARLPHPPAVLDLRAAIPDAEFADHIHLGPPGARRLSDLLSGRIAEIAP
ncbi:MAG: hypothetical protein KF773_33910 [Deltaproteobacteria bacterium]|nr:hypothetical protein [Deltaproteobacteria bacterium]